jgi:hypothetical protein
MRSAALAPLILGLFLACGSESRPADGDPSSRVRWGTGRWVNGRWTEIQCREDADCSHGVPPPFAACGGFDNDPSCVVPTRCVFGSSGSGVRIGRCLP